MRQSQVVVNSSCMIDMSGQAIGLADADRTRQRQPEHAEAIRHADTEMNAERGRRHQPAIEPGRGDDAFAVEQSRGGRKAAPRLIQRRHSFPRYGTSELYLVIGLSRLSTFLYGYTLSLSTASRTSGSRPAPPASSMREDRRAHARIPEFLDVLGDRCRCLAVALAAEELADLVGHIDKLIRRTCATCSRADPARRCREDLETITARDADQGDAGGFGGAHRKRGRRRHRDNRQARQSPRLSAPSRSKRGW